MSLIYYEGVSESGQKVRGSYNGTKSDLLAELQSAGVLVTRLKEEQEKLKGGRFVFADLHETIEQLHYLLVSGLQVDQALGVMVKNSRKKPVREFWGEVLAILKDGVPFSQSLKQAAAKNDCPMEDFFVNVLAVGEEVGDLKGALHSLREYLDFKSTMIKEIRSALTYPAFLFIAGLVTMLLVLGLILPRFASVYSPQELQQLPAVSQLTLSFGNWVHGHPLLVLAALVLGAALLVSVASSQRLRRLLGEGLSRLPLVRNAVHYLDLARLFASLGTMLGSGVNLSRAIRLADTVVGNPSLRNILRETGEELKKGQKLSETWRRHTLIPDDVVALAAVGETGACLDEVFQRTGKKYMELFKAKVALLLTFLEPAIIVFLGIFIGFIVIAILLAVVSMSDLYA